MSNTDDPNLGPPSRHRADDYLEALASGAFTPAILHPLSPPTTTTTVTTTDTTDAATPVTTQSRTPNGDLDLLDHTAIITDALTCISPLDGNEGEEEEEDVDENEPLEMDYGSDDDVSVEDEGKGDAAELSLRTSTLMDNFRDYVSTVDGDGPNDGSSAATQQGAVSADEFLAAIDGGQDLEEGLNSLLNSSENYKEGDAPLLTTDGKATGMMRDFTIEKEGHGIDDNGQEDPLSPRNSRYLTRYRYAWLRAKRVKRGIGMIVLASVLIAIISSARKSRKEAKLPDWKKDMNEILAEEEKEHNDHVNEDGSVMAVPSEPLQTQPGHILQHMGTKPTNTDDEGGASGILSDIHFTNAQSRAYQQITQKYAPQWYSRADGYDTTTYDQSLIFCARQKMMIPCPYEAICPDGPNHPPYGGNYKDEEPTGSWAPVIDNENAWVQVSSGGSSGPGGPKLAAGGGSHDDNEKNHVCMTYNSLHEASKPKWGERGGNEEQTRHVLCCLSDLDGVQESEESLELGLGVPDDYKFEASPGDQMAMGETTSTKPPMVSGGDSEPNDLSSIEQTLPDPPGPVVDAEIIAEEYANAERYEPTWYSRDSGWNGQTYDEAVAFCDSQGIDETRFHFICPYEVICPTGQLHIPYGGWVDEPNGSWAPVSDYDNDWVQIGPNEKEMCRTYMNLNLMAPIWGSTGEENEEITRYILCCAAIDFAPEEEGVDIDDDDDLLTAIAAGMTLPESSDSTTITTTTAEALTPTTTTTTTTKAATAKPTAQSSNKPTEVVFYETTGINYEPITLSRAKGWTGQTYNEAIGFCNAFLRGPDDPMQLCPYVAYCPFGVNTTPYGGIKEEGPNGSWAPVSDGQNAWVQLGNDRKCNLYADVYPDESFPGWGITGQDNEDMTRHIMCCHPKHSLSIPDSAPNSSELVNSAVTHGHPIPDSAPTSSELVHSAVTTFTEDITVGGETQQVYAMLKHRMDNRLEPVPHGREVGWSGQNYAEARNFCGSHESKEPCTFESLCPNGIEGGGAMVFEKGPVWAPIMDQGSEMWVEMRSRGYCDKHPTLASYDDVTRYVICCATAVEQLGPGEDQGNIPFNIVNGSPPTPPPLPTIHGSPPALNYPKSPSPPTSEMNAAFIYAEERFKPVIFDRFDGWTGQTYSEGIQFCAAKNSKIPCPYEAVCPMGTSGQPMGGKNTMMNELWAPIMDSANGWVQIGYRDTCEKYADMNPHPPNWGMTGEENEKITQIILCCDEPDGGGPIDEDVEEQTLDYEIMQLTNTEQLVLDTMHPIWFGREHGYHGTTHEAAEIFCRTIVDMHLCPIEAYCPNGPQDSRELFLQKDTFQDEQWAPVSNYDNKDTAMGNDWVLIGTVDGDQSNTCSGYDQLNNGRSPPWTADGSQTELKEHVLCCAKQSEIKYEQEVSIGINPIWLDEKHGWSGGSYQDGVKFCRELGGKKLCPYTVYCPHGPGVQPIGGHSADFNIEGEQWAPYFAEDELMHWVQVGTKYDNSATTCYTHHQLEGGPPVWGLSNESSIRKRHIQCCSI